MNSSRVCHAQIITELLRVELLVWEAKQKVEIDKAAEMASGGGGGGGERFLCRGCSECVAVCV